MNQGKYVFAQIFEFLPPYKFQKCVKKYEGDKKITSLSCWQQFLCMSCGQIAKKDSLRSLLILLNAHREKLYHLGFGSIFNSKLILSTLARANENRSYKIYKDLAQELIVEANKLYANDEEFQFEISNQIYAIDSTTINLCLKTFRWAKFRRKKGAIKVHTELNLRGNIPDFIIITDGKVHDVNFLDKIEFQAGGIYLMDRAYIDYERLHKIEQSKAFFTTRAKRNMKYYRVCSNKVDKSSGVTSDQIIKLTSLQTRNKYPDKLRRIGFYDKKKPKQYFFLTNNFTLDAKIIADLYVLRWKIETFFKWIKQNLKIKSFWGRSPNAVKTQIWTAICVYVLIAIMKKKLNVKLKMSEILQIVDSSLFDKTPLKQLLSDQDAQNSDGGSLIQLKLWDN